MPHCRGHPPDLPVSSFIECELQPGCRNGLSKPDGNGSRGQHRVAFQKAGDGRKDSPAVDEQ